MSQEEFIVPSQSGNGKYKVSHLQGWACECPDFKNRSIECKHIKATQFFLKLRNGAEVQDFPIPDFPTQETEQAICPECKNTEIIKVGQRKNKNGVKQKLQCKACKAYFVNEPLKYVKGNSKIVVLTLDLYYKGLSLRDISDTLFQFYGLKTHHETIRRWIRTYTKKINAYTSQFKPQTCGTIHTDEQIIFSKGQHRYTWNSIDKDSRFLLAATITKGRTTADARKHFREVKANSDKEPEKIITDSLHSYKRAIHKEFKTVKKKTAHVSILGRRKETDNNLIERYHNDFREFDKIRRGFKADNTAQEWANGYKLYHNFVRNHTTLGTTPAQAAQIDLNLSRNKWDSLLRKSLTDESDRQEATDEN